MPSNKDRLYIALHARGGKPTMVGKEDTYHWALMVGPKLESKYGKGVRYHAKEHMEMGVASRWKFEEIDCSLVASSMVLVRIMVGKVKDGKRLVEIIRSTPIREGQQGWNCVSWVKEALERLEADPQALGTNVLEWEKMRNKAMDYCQQKKDQHRFDGKGDFDMSRPPTWDLIKDKETIE
ncbi:unnamed protein product [Penicillium salamii]|nr:unnamed protein product [Penicillium salamii]